LINSQHVFKVKTKKKTEIVEDSRVLVKKQQSDDRVSKKKSETDDKKSVKKSRDGSRTTESVVVPNEKSAKEDSQKLVSKKLKNPNEDDQYGVDKDPVKSKSKKSQNNNEDMGTESKLKVLKKVLDETDAVEEKSAKKKIQRNKALVDDDNHAYITENDSSNNRNAKNKNQQDKQNDEQLNDYNHVNIHF
jgi:hypothetical protein